MEHVLRELAIPIGGVMILLVLRDAFETVILPRTVKRAFGLASSFFLNAGRLFRLVGRLRPSAFRQSLLSSFAPASLLMLMTVWALLLMLGFALVQYGVGSPVNAGGFPGYLYFSGVTFLTLGYGDLAPKDALGRVLAVSEAGTGFAFLALVISAIPVIYSAFSRREVTMLLLDSRAGSDPSAGELIHRYVSESCLTNLTEVLREWEVFSAQLMESYISYPMLAYYRSQHDDQSWLRSLTAILDTCALLELGFESGWEDLHEVRFQAKRTFAMARHVIVDLAYLIDAHPHSGLREPLDKAALGRISEYLRVEGFRLDTSEAACERFRQACNLYEPFVCGLSKRLLMDLPDWVPASERRDNWQISSWDEKHF